MLSPELNRLIGTIFKIIDVSKYELHKAFIILSLLHVRLFNYLNMKFYVTIKIRITGRNV